MLRLFVGIKIPDDITSELAAISNGVPGARWVAPEDMHVTLRFIGDVDDDIAEDLDAALDAVDGHIFDLTLSGLGVFETRDRVRAVWADVRQEDALDALHARVEAAIARAGQGHEKRKFVPHVTLARLKNVPVAQVQPYLQLNGSVRFPPFTVDAFQLFRSHLGKSGARYEVLADYPLRSFDG